MKNLKHWFALAALMTFPAFATSSSGNAMLDLATCQGAVLLTQSLEGNEQAVERVDAMETLFERIGDQKHFVRTENDANSPTPSDNSFITPAETTTVVNTTVDSFSTTGFGIFRGPSLILRGTFDEVRSTLSSQHSTEYENCSSRGLLQVCTRQFAPELSAMIMSHPRQPAEQVVLVCVEHIDR